jgi:DNA-binding MarR family transcriptional regulator
MPPYSHLLPIRAHAIDKGKIVLKNRTFRRKVVQIMSAVKKPNNTIIKAVVYDLIYLSKKGVTTITLTEKTGYSKKKIEKAVDQLEKQGKVKSFLQGVYTKA